jgi:hypothetical protein
MNSTDPFDGDFWELSMKAHRYLENCGYAQWRMMNRDRVIGGYWGWIKIPSREFIKSEILSGRFPLKMSLNRDWGYGWKDDPARIAAPQLKFTSPSVAVVIKEICKWAKVKMPKLPIKEKKRKIVEIVKCPKCAGKGKIELIRWESEPPSRPLREGIEKGGSNPRPNTNRPQTPPGAQQK